jgi:integrating conjugative element membrane protein (TIGR03747 family)
VAGFRDSAYPAYGSSTNPLVHEHSTLGRLFRWLRWLVTLCVLVLVIDLVCVTFIWADGGQALADLLAQEKAALGLRPDSAAGRFVDSAIASAHDWAFVKTGIGAWLSTQRGGLLSAIINGLWVFVETAMLGLQLFALRLSVLVLSLPLFIAVGGTAVADGVYGWLMRRTGGARESGFIYHRAKRTFPMFLLFLWVVYLVPPVPMDPRWVIPPFVILFAITLRLFVAFFKKHL